VPAFGEAGDRRYSMLDSMIEPQRRRGPRRQTLHCSLRRGKIAVMLSAESASGSYSVRGGGDDGPDHPAYRTAQALSFDPSPPHSRKSNTRLRMPSRLPLLISPRLSRRLRSSRLLRWNDSGPDCAQASVGVYLGNNSRRGDLPGALPPMGSSQRLLRRCAHL